MANRSSIVYQVSDIWSKLEDTPSTAGESSNMNLQQNQCTNALKSIWSCNTGSCLSETQESRSAGTWSTQQDINTVLNFGPHLLKNINVGLDVKGMLKWNIKRKEYQMGDSEPVRSLEKYGQFMCASMKPKGLSQGIFPFSEELLAGARQNRKISGKPFSRPDTQLQPTEEEKRNFRELGLTHDQIIRLERLGLNTSRFLPKQSESCQHDPRIPPSFNLDGFQCYLCASLLHVAYGVAFILKEDIRVLGVAVQRNVTSRKVVLIQIAATDVVLLIPMNANGLSAPKPLQVIFRDSKILKTGVQIQRNLKDLWLDFKIDSNFFVELNELLELCWKKFGSLSCPSQRPLTLGAIASYLGYQIWETSHITFSD